jgi:FtsP/CotA-like multicopper oxidase with cupredoxin domain
MIRPLRSVLAIAAVRAVVIPAGSHPERLPVVVPNDNRVAAGHLDGDTLRLALVVEMAEWYPGSDTGSSIAVAAFAEEGKPPRIPGPLIRVPEGTVLDVSVRNALPDSTVHLGGLRTRPGTADSLMALAPGVSAHLRFAAGAPGTYFYAARIGHPSEAVERETAIGAFVVDPAGGSPPDRVFVINIWSDPVDSVTWREALAINGRSFPYNERVTATVGDSVRWRWVNGSIRNHPMHLHGFYFRVDAKGDVHADSAYAPDARRLVVTEDMAPFTTMGVVWSPHREGNWLFHCHIGFHVSPEAQIDRPAADAHAHTSADFEQHMAGLVLALVVRPPPGWTAHDAPSRRHLHLYTQEGRPRGRAPRALGYVISEDGRVPAPDSVEIPGRALVLTRGEFTDVTIVNRMPEPTAVHWHGLELESYSDGMAGWSGSGMRVAPPVMPGDSFTAHLTLERAGTFMYHTHLNDYEQLTSGLYGPIVVLEPGDAFDPTSDHVFVVGWDGPEPPHLLLNGDSLPEPLELRAGVAHRLRFVNIGMAVRVEITLLRDTTLMSWRPRAWDGADLPPAQSLLQPARTVVAVGQTADFLFDPPGPGTYRLVLTAPDGKKVMEQEMHVGR